MKGTNKYMAMLMLSVSLMGVESTSARAEMPTVSGDIGVASQYVWRGVVQKGQPAVQGDLNLALEGFTASAWFSNSYVAASYAKNPTKEVTEFDFTADYSGSIGDFGYSLGGIYYTYLYDPNSNFVEGYAGISYDAVVSPSVTAYYTAKGASNAGTSAGFYKTGDLWVDFGLSTSVAGFDLSGTASYVKWKGDAISRAVTGGLDTHKNGISLVQFGISKEVEAGGVKVTPSLTASIPVIGKSSDGFRYIYGAKVYNEFVASVSFSY